MENTKENVVKLLKVRRHNFAEMCRIFDERGDEKEVQRYSIRIAEMDMVINILTNQDEFDSYCDIWKEELEEQEQCQKKSS